MYESSHFIAAVDSRRIGLRAGGIARFSELRSPGESIVSVDSDGFRCDFLLSPATSTARHRGEDEILLVLHGELYPDFDQGAARRCLNAYMTDDLRFVGSLHGSFVLAVVDARRDRILFITDPVNSRKLFFGVHDGLAWLSTMHTFWRHPGAGRPDVAGMAHCLVNGIPLNGRTPFDGVRLLERASIHEIKGSKVTSSQYWRFEPKPGTGVDRKSLRGDLRDALLAAVERRLPSDGGVCLSLSGGYDSTAILGALSLIGVPDVRCFSYRNPTETKRSDASVAGQMAAIAGYGHTVVEAYRDDVGTVIDENIRRGCGMTRLVVETDLWRTLRERKPAMDLATLWFGDECFGMNPPRTLESDADVLNSLAFADWASLGPLEALFPRSVSAEFGAALRADLDSFIDRNRAIGDKYVLRDYLYLHHRLPRLLSWREAFAEPCGKVRNPLIDREILELRQQFPKHLTVGKRLFRDTVTESFPDLFAIDRAAGGVGWYAGHWCRAVVRTQSDHLAGMIRANPSPLDPYVPPDGLLRVLDREARRAGALRRLNRRAGAWKGQVQERIRFPGRRAHIVRRPRQRTVDPAVFILRAITLRELFRQRPTT